MGLINTIFGEKPKVPDFEKVDPSKEQLGAISGNLAALPSAQRLGAGVNAFNAEQLKQLSESALPGFGQISQNIGDALLSQSRGEIPEDISSEISRRTNVQSVSGGFGGSSFAQNLRARDLGLTSLELTNRSLDSASRWLQAVRAPQFDISSMFITPGQRIQVMQQERDSAFNRDLMAAQVAASPSPFGAFVQRNLQSMIDDGRQIGMTFATMGQGGQVNPTPGPNEGASSFDGGSGGLNGVSDRVMQQRVNDSMSRLGMTGGGSGTTVNVNNSGGGGSGGFGGFSGMGGGFGSGGFSPSAISSVGGAGAGAAGF